MVTALLMVALQCPDGSPPPCARPAPRVAVAAAPDPSRIAILPFRVTTADSLLGEGLAELVATEFTGESGPRAVNMGTVLRAWRGAGGGLRSPLAQPRAIQLAREMGAGLYVEGSVVGLGPRLTINASVVSVPGGDARRAAPVVGPADSLDVLVGRLTSSLLAASGSERSASRARLTDSPGAMRSYVEGLAHWRRINTEQAAISFERAFEQDTSFARAAFMRWLAGGWIAAGSGNWGRTTWRLKDRLSVADQLLLVAQLGAAYPAARPLAQRLEDRQRAAERLTESAEAQYFYGDYLYHYASALDIPMHQAFERARQAFERSVALDSQGTVLQHLLEIAFLTGDTGLAMRAFVPFDRLVGNGWDWGMIVAALRGDQAMFAAQRGRAGPVRDRAVAWYVLPDALVPATAAQEIYDVIERNAPGERDQPLPVSRVVDAIIRGRPSEAARAAARLPAALAWFHDQLLVTAALFGDGDSPAAEAALARLRTVSRDTTDAVAARGACLVALRDWRTGSGPVGEARTFRGNPRCTALVAAVRSVRQRAPDAGHLLQVADSVIRFNNTLANLDFESLALALAWEEFGDARRALSMVRVRPYGFASVTVEATRRKEEGRLAAMAGDTAGAIAAYRMYLVYRRDAEPPLIPQRDSVLAQVRRIGG